MDSSTPAEVIVSSLPNRLAAWAASQSMPIRIVLFGLVWLAVWRAAVLLEYAPHASIWFPPAGLSFAAFLVVGLRAAPIIFICALIATFWVDQIYDEGGTLNQILLGGVLFGTAHCFSYGLCAEILRHMARDVIHHSLPKLVISFLALGSLAALLAAALGSHALSMAGTISLTEARAILLPWWVGDMAGVIVLAPVFIGLIARQYPEIVPWLGGFRFESPSNSWPKFGLKLLLCLALLVAAMGTAAWLQQPEAAFAVFFLIIPQMWLVYTESAFRTALSVAMFSVLSALLVRWFGLLDQALVYQFAINVIAASAYFGLAVPSLIADNHQLRRIAMTDALTEVWSRASFTEQASLELLRATRYRDQVCLIMFDIDRFKSINDQFGHSCGDEALRETATIAKATLRETDLLGRFGGDEFVVLLPRTGLTQAIETADRIRESLERLRLSHPEARVTGSFGVALADAEDAFKDLFERADSALYEAKNQGRNRVVPESHEPHESFAPEAALPAALDRTD